MSAVKTPRSEKTYSLTFEDNQGLIHMQAKVGFKWAKSASVLLDYDDAFQIASLAFLKAVEGFDPSKGITFSAYFTKAAFSQFRKEIGVMSGVKNLNTAQRSDIADRKAENKMRAAAGQEQLPDMSYGLRPLYFSEIHGVVDDQAEPFENTLQSTVATPEEIVGRRQQWDQATARLSPMAQLVVEWLQDPPEELLRELRGQMALAEIVTGSGGRARNGWRDGLTIANIGRFLAMLSEGKSRGEFALVERELMDVAQALEDV